MGVLGLFVKLVLIATGLLILFSLFFVSAFFACIWLFIYFIAVFLIGMWKGPRGRLFNEDF